ncbi:Proton-dependent oligopeptide transporter family [Parasponia andersonii]|uniref:Proton-dependent oligopeptide transporter family n=1 Tax=Parasponia andersonii TaxID=3476 RepID=A0A2P5E0Y0_PARAD|nr:Proton-dependent oligopeptide transporter family [Parasponia andersonii]
MTSFQNEGSKLYTGDGSVDIHGKPVLKQNTGNWKACFFILGIVMEMSQQQKLSPYVTPRIGATVADGYWGRYWTIAAFSTIYFIEMSQQQKLSPYVTPRIGATVADGYWGRYWTIAAFSTIYFIGMCALSLSAAIPAFGIYFYFFGIYLVALGRGGIKPCVSTFGADQFDDSDPKERVMKGSFFDWFYFSFSIGILMAGTFLVWIEDNVGWGLGFCVPTLCMGIAIIVFLLGTPLYRLQKHSSGIWNVPSKWNLEVPKHSSLLYEPPDISSAVEELKSLIRMFPIWATGIVFAAVYAQMSTTFLEQAMMMNKTIGFLTIPPASLSTCYVICVLFLVPIYDRIIVAIARKFTQREKGFSSFQRMGIGLFISVLSPSAAAVLEVYRLRLAKDLDLTVALEFFYEESPKSLRSFCTALYLPGFSLGFYMNSFILTVVTSFTTKGGKVSLWCRACEEGTEDSGHYFFFCDSLEVLWRRAKCWDFIKSKRMTHVKDILLGLFLNLSRLAFELISNKLLWFIWN